MFFFSFSPFVSPSACQSRAALPAALTSLRLELSKLSGICHRRRASQTLRSDVYRCYGEARAPSSVVGLLITTGLLVLLAYKSQLDDYSMILRLPILHQTALVLLETHTPEFYTVR